MIHVVRISAGPTLRGRHVTLRPMHDGDAGDVRELRAAPVVAEWWGPLEDDFPLSDDPEVIRMCILVEHLLTDRGHHRVTIDPAVDNVAAVRCYEKAGFRRVGVMEASWRDPHTGRWRDALLMELVRLRD